MSKRRHDYSTELAILGVHLKSDGYPNVKYRIQALHELLGAAVTEINFPFRDAASFESYPARLSILRWIKAGARLIYSHLYVLCAYFRQGRPRVVYLPYPAVFMLCLLRLIPKAWRPGLIIADAFISLYDTIVEDRRLVRPGSILAALIRWVEICAYRVANTVIVDTEINASYFVETFRLDPVKVVALPLAIDESAFRFSPNLSSSRVCKILFIGTFVPLQGVDVIAESIKRLTEYPDIQFKLIGYGQTAPRVERILGASKNNNVTWVKTWQDNTALSEAIREADICLGIFGSGAKTQRVWPLKNYAYMSVGRMVITADTTCARAMLAVSRGTPFVTIPADNAGALAAKIAELARDPIVRQHYAHDARLFYEQHLRASIAVAAIVDRVRSVATRGKQDSD